MRLNKKALRYFLLAAILLYVSVPIAVYLMSRNSAAPTAIGVGCMRSRAVHTLSFIKPGGIVCEIGIGRGVLRSEAKNRGFTYWGVDMDPNVSPDVVARVPPLPDMQSMPADAIIMESIIEHLADYDQVDQLIGECFDALAPDGLVVIRVPDIRYARWRFWDATPDHTYVTSSTRIAKICHDNGFEIVESGHYLDQFTGWRAFAVYWAKSVWPWQAMHDCLYEPWQESAFSKIGEKVPGTYMVCRKKER